MMLTFQDVLKMYIDKFGDEPVVTGSNFGEGVSLMDALIVSLQTNTRYVEEVMPDDTDS